MPDAQEADPSQQLPEEECMPRGDVVNMEEDKGGMPNSTARDV